MFETSSQWTRVHKPCCDVCGKRAEFAHPLGGLRCKTCPRPEVKRWGVFDTAQKRWWPRYFDTQQEAQAHLDWCKGPGTSADVGEHPSASGQSEPKVQ